MPSPAPRLCRAKNCWIEIPEAKFMCRGHWQMVSKELKRRIWNAYTMALDLNQSPSSMRHFLEVTRKAVDMVAELEGYQTTKR